MYWVSVKESYPENEGQYLVSVKHPKLDRRQMKVARFNTSGRHKKPHFYGNQTFKASYITHWMTLPNQPQEG